MAQTTRPSDRIGDIKDKATEAFSNVADRAGEAADRVADQGRALGENFQEVGGNIKGAVDRSIKDQPMATLALAAMAGFVLGAIWKS
jgi:ElaB/YqjD/DUF883 family membrane-anchored ribosome-binding protein